MTKFYATLSYLLDRLSESSTWQGIGFFVGMIFSGYHDLEWGAAAAIGGAVSGLIKMLFPDKFKKQEEK